MKMLFLSFLAATHLMAQVPKEHAPGQRKPSIEERKPVVNEKLKTELLTKYDADKNGKLSPEERSKITPEDRKKLREAGLGRPPGKGPKPKKKD